MWVCFNYIIYKKKTVHDQIVARGCNDKRVMDVSETTTVDSLFSSSVLGVLFRLLNAIRIYVGRRID